MPNFPEERRNGGAEEPLPEGEARQRAQIIPDPQIRPAEAEGGKQPAQQQLQADEELAEEAVPLFQGLDGIGPGAQEDPGKKAAHQPPEDEGGGQNSRLRFGRGSS